MRFLLTASIAAALFAAAPAQALFDRDPDYDYDALLQQGSELRDVFWKLTTAHTDRCKDTTYRLGFEVIAINPDWKSWDRYAEQNDLTMGTTIIQVAAGSPAAAAGIQRGDELVSLGDREFKAQRRAGKMDKQVDNIRKAQHRSEGQAIDVVVDRAGERIALSLTPARVCAVDITVMHPENGSVLFPNDASRFLIETYQLSAAQSPEDVAIVVAHEFAHFVLGHYTKGKVADGVARGIGAVTGLMLPIVDTGSVARVVVGIGDEKDADRESIALAAGLGVTPDAVLAFWERLQAATQGTRSKVVSGHPISDSRIAALREQCGQEPVALQ